MSFDSQRPLVEGRTNGTINGTANKTPKGQTVAKADRGSSKTDGELNAQLKASKQFAKFHGDTLIGDRYAPTGFLANLRSNIDDMRRIFTFNNAPKLGVVVGKMLAGQGLDMKAGAQLVGSMSNDSHNRAKLVETQVKAKYDRMLHPPLTYLGDAFQYRAADGKFNSVLHPHLGQAGAPYAKTVPSKTHPLGALPDPGDLFDRLMAREDTKRDSTSGLSSMLIYHATIIIHDIFRTNASDKNISDSSSYLDLSPLYGYTDEMQRKVRDDKYKLGLLKPDTFAEDRLLRQPPGVCIMLVMYNRYHNYAATQLRRINENGRFSIPEKFEGAKLVAIAKNFVTKKDKSFEQVCKDYRKAWDVYNANGEESSEEYRKATQALEDIIKAAAINPEDRKKFEDAYDAAWKKLDDDLFNTARLITCGMYIQISIHDYLRALMGFHQWNTNFTLDPRIAMTEHKNVSRGLGNQVTVEFNLLYRFHCAISKVDEDYTESFISNAFGGVDPKSLSLPQFLKGMEYLERTKDKIEPSQQTFGLSHKEEVNFTRNSITGLFDDQKMIDQLKKSMNDPISNFGPRNVPKCLKSVEILGIMQARKWEIGTLNDFRDFFGMKRHESFESITRNVDVQNALRDLYEHPDKVELYPGVFCESGEDKNLDPGPSDVDSALWAAIFSDAITLVRSDRFYTVDWNTNSLTSWGMKEVTPDNDVLKSSVFHRLLQRAFPEWFPYDSIQFFHPFYTARKNAEFAREQGYGQDFRMQINTPDNTLWLKPEDYIYNTNASDPRKPEKPKYLYKYAEIKALLSDTTDNIVHPARLELHNLPPKVQEVLTPGQRIFEVKQKGKDVDFNAKIITSYFNDLMRHIVMRESITMDDKRPVYQLDITRDFAIPVTTRYVADFLGFGHLIKSEKNPGAPHSENEIYQHITNCQTFLTSNADETKLLKRRQAFKTSMTFLFKLTQDGNVLEANRWPITRWTRNGLRYLWTMGRSGSGNPMTEHGFKVAQQILSDEGDSGRAAAVLLLVALDIAYNSVLVFTSVLHMFIKDLYNLAKEKPEEAKSCDWLKVQNLASEDDEKSTRELEELVLRAQKSSVKLPIIRKAIKDCEIKDGNTTIPLKAYQTIFCDVYRAEQEDPAAFANADTLTYRSSFAQIHAGYHPKSLAILALRTMIKVVAQMKNLRRGHDAQGRLKRINLDASYEGYSNFMAPMRMKKIERDAEKARVAKVDVNDDEKTKQAKMQAKKDAEKVFTKAILKPASDTFMTPEWDEMIPFPTTWKVRFDGFGPSDYLGEKGALKDMTTLPDDYPPFYQPQGASHFGGSFATPVCICEAQGAECRCKAKDAKAQTEMPADKVDVQLTGCGMP